MKNAEGNLKPGYPSGVSPRVFIGQSLPASRSLQTQRPANVAPQRTHNRDLLLTGATPNPLPRQCRPRQPPAGDVTKTTSGKVGVLEDIIKTIIDGACC